jgi:ParB family chromosome partitioning protein
MVRDGVLSAGHARALIGSQNAVDLARQIVAKGLSVRDTERLVKAQATMKPSATRTLKAPEKDADTRALEADLSANLRMIVRINHLPGAESGQLTIAYESLDDLDNLCRILSNLPDTVVNSKS